MSDRPIDRSVLRILDANFNRAREALRVMEEYARFVLDDASLSAAIKESRHAFVEAFHTASGLGLGEGNEGTKGRRDGGVVGPPQSTILARDVQGDIGRGITTPTEVHRADAAHVALAAAGRLSEALRVIEEYGKVLDPAFAAAVQAVRYRGYELERRLAITVRARERLASVRLYVIVTESLCGHDWFETAQAALAGGAESLQLREKHLPDREVLDRAKRLVTLCHDRGALLIVNDRPDIAAAAGADGVHLGPNDLPVAAARRVFPTAAIVGVSTHTVEQVEAAAGTAPDYIAVGPMFDSVTKPQGHIAGTATLAAARNITGIPLVAIGGIDESNVGEVWRAGPWALCVCRAVIAAPDPREAAARLRSLIGQHHAPNEVQG